MLAQSRREEEDEEQENESIINVSWEETRRETRRPLRPATKRFVVKQKRIPTGEEETTQSSSSPAVAIYAVL